MDNPKQQIAERLKQANNVLVTVSTNPSVDQLAACIGLTLMLNKLSKHATAVFSGQIPSTIEFLQPEATLEKTTDSLRDFIISLDKAKADKLRYKVEDKVVKIFITPYRTSIGEKDLEFSQGDFNVDVVVALGVHEQTDLDQAITTHGRILHDATVVTISTATPSAIGAINWQDAAASSLSEIVAGLSDDLGKNMLDGQIATSLLTGIVAETERFSNDKTSAQTMSVSARLMSAGANQQLVATKLEQPAEIPPEPPAELPPIEPPSTQPPAGPGSADDHPPLSSPTPVALRPEPPKPPSNEGMLEVSHDGDEKPEPEVEKPDELANKQINIDDQGILHRVDNEPIPGAVPPAPATPPETLAPPSETSGSHFMSQPPSMGGTLTANTTPEGLDPPNDALSLPNVEPPMLHRPPEPPADDSPVSPLPASDPVPVNPPVSDNAPSAAPAPPSLDDLRSSVDSAAANSEPLPKPDAFNSQIAFDDLHAADVPAPNTDTSPVAPTLPPLNKIMPSDEPVDNALDMPAPPQFVPTTPLAQPPTDGSDSDSATPPPVPPPLTPVRPQ